MYSTKINQTLNYMYMYIPLCNLMVCHYMYKYMYKYMYTIHM